MEYDFNNHSFDEAINSFCINQENICQKFCNSKLFLKGIYQKQKFINIL